MRSNTSRVHLTIPVFVYGYSDSGSPFKEMSRTLAIDANGGLVELSASVSKEHPLLLVNIATGQFISCRVVSTQRTSNGKASVGIYFALPSPHFWGLEFPSEDDAQATQKNPRT